MYKSKIGVGLAALALFAGTFVADAATISCIDGADVPGSTTDWTANLTFILTPVERSEIPAEVHVNWTRPAAQTTVQLVGAGYNAALTVRGPLARSTAAIVTAAIRKMPAITDTKNIDYATVVTSN